MKRRRRGRAAEGGAGCPAGVFARVAAFIDRGLTLDAIAARVGPRPDTIWRWLAEDGDLRARYDRAASLRSEFLADEVVAIADARDRPFADAKLRVDARKWMVERMETAALTKAEPARGDSRRAQGAADHAAWVAALRAEEARMRAEAERRSREEGGAEAARFRIAGKGGSE